MKTAFATLTIVLLLSYLAVTAGGGASHVSPTTSTARATEVWQPAGITPWQLQLSDLPVDPSYDVVMYDVDLFDNDADVVASLHAQGRVVIAYFSAGS